LDALKKLFDDMLQKRLDRLRRLKDSIKQMDTQAMAVNVAKDVEEEVQRMVQQKMQTKVDEQVVCFDIILAKIELKLFE
jgi:hypothetical protein